MEFWRKGAKRMVIPMVSKICPVLLAVVFFLPLSSACASVATSENLSAANPSGNSLSSTNALLTSLSFEELFEQSPAESILDAPLAVGQLVGRSGSSSEPASLDGLATSVSSPAGTSAYAGSMPTDFDLDGKVGQSDYQIWRKNFNPTTTQYGMPGDANSDGYISAIDFVMLRDTLGTTSGVEEGTLPITAPEPGHTALVMFSLITLSCLFRRERA